MRFFVNVDHVATVREARKTDEPDPARAAVLVELAGADGITVHLREDRRHIQDRDVRLLAGTLRTPLNLELASAAEILELALELRPHQATIVPEKREEVTTEGGLDLSNPDVLAWVEPVAARLMEAGIRTSLFVDPTDEAMKASAAMGVPAVELHTGEYANARTESEREHEVGRIHRAAVRARELGLDVHAGHGLTYENVIPVAAIPELEELNIGHSIVSRAVLVGMERAVREMAELIRRGRRGEGE
jgi:pyridoxine 5-phosphate synthase